MKVFSTKTSHNNVCNAINAAVYSFLEQSRYQDAVSQTAQQTQCNKPSVWNIITPAALTD